MLISDKLKAGSSVKVTTGKPLTEWVLKDGKPVATKVNVGVEPYKDVGEISTDFYRALGRAIIKLHPPYE
ncbi:hypothetical protein HY570_03325 [Candidatus Micrarchaeota archaeon]|nr:hypothetical protein [Candidatus Micrarchaeota archaeon]